MKHQTSLNSISKFRNILPTVQNHVYIAHAKADKWQYINRKGFQFLQLVTLNEAENSRYNTINNIEYSLEQVIIMSKECHVL